MSRLGDVEAFEGLAGDCGNDLEVLVRCRMISPASSAVAAMIRSGIDGARCWPRSASRVRTSTARSSMAGVWYCTGIHRQLPPFFLSGPALPAPARRGRGAEQPRPRLGRGPPVCGAHDRSPRRRRNLPRHRGPARRAWAVRYRWRGSVALRSRPVISSTESRWPVATSMMSS